MANQYKFQFGVFDKGEESDEMEVSSYDGKLYRKRNINRVFTPLFESYYNEEEMSEKLKLLERSKRELLQPFLSTNEEPKTLLLGDWHGYRVYKLD